PYRSKALPEVPTLQEAGLEGFAVESWQGLVAPAGTPPAIVEKINQDVVAVLRQPNIERALESQGFAISAGRPSDVDRTVIDDNRLYAKVLARTGLRL
ncbi:MAG: tripartite tricarboxylate transporter substrate-binding protein, partial [Pseudomonadota bacterium]